MTDYTVNWEINLEADTPEEAAKLAWIIQHDYNSLATWFKVKIKDTDKTHTIDVGGQ